MSHVACETLHHLHVKFLQVSAVTNTRENTLIEFAGVWIEFEGVIANRDLNLHPEQKIGNETNNLDWHLLLCVCVRVFYMHEDSFICVLFALFGWGDKAINIYGDERREAVAYACEQEY